MWLWIDFQVDAGIYESIKEDKILSLTKNGGNGNGKIVVKEEWFDIVELMKCQSQVQKVQVNFGFTYIDRVFLLPVEI